MEEGVSSQHSPTATAGRDSAELPAVLEDHGLNVYTTPDHPPLHATFKRKPEDFVVTEINSKGQLVRLDRSDVPPLPPAAEIPVSVKKRRIVEHGGSNRPDPASVPPLQDLVTPPQYQALAQLAATYRSTVEADPDLRVDLGIIEGKASRGLIHCAMRVEFPVLLSVTYRNQQEDTGLLAIPDPKYKQLVELLSPEEAEQVLLFASTSSTDSHRVLELQPDQSKPHRTKVHRLLNELFGAYITTSYSPQQSHQPPPCKAPKLEDGATPTEATPTPHPAAIVLQVRKKHQRSDKKSSLNLENEVVTKFVLRKRNREHLESIQKLSQLLNCGASQFSTSGTKDKIAITTQEVTVRGVTAQRLAKIRGELSHWHMDIGNFEYVKVPLQLGRHCGNHFKVVLRSVHPKEKGEWPDLEDVVNSSLEAVRQRGFVNYFGLQRLNRNLNTPRIGLALLHNNPRKAMDLLLSYSHFDSQVKEHIKNGEYGEAMKALPPHQAREKLMLQKLHQHGHTEHACWRAFMTVPYNSRCLFTHSLSSLLWNHTASYRIQTYGMRAVEGDLVMRERKEWDNIDTCEISAREYVHVLTQQDVESKQYSLDDVILPVVGTTTIFPANSVADRMKEMMAAIGLTLASFRLPRLGLNSLGVYRKLLARPKNFTWTVTKSSMPHPLSPMKNVPSAAAVCPTVTGFEPPTAASPGAESASSETQVEPLNVELDFDLSPSIYATVLIREITKSLY